MCQACEQREQGISKNERSQALRVRDKKVGVSVELKWRLEGAELTHPRPHCRRSPKIIVEKLLVQQMWKKNVWQQNVEKECVTTKCGKRMSENV